MGWMYAGTSVRNTRERRRTSLYRRRQSRVAALKLPPPRERMARFPTRSTNDHALDDAIRDCQPLRFQPIEPRPLRPFVFRESSCDFLECRASGRRCIAAQGRNVQLDYQIAYCLGERHQVCGIYRKRTGRLGATSTRQLAYAAVAIAMFGLLALALIRAIGAGSTLEMGRALGLG